MFISTPDGRDWFHKAYERGQSGDDPEWASWRWSTYANPHVPDDEVDAAQKDMPERIFKQEYLAEFLDESGGVFEELDTRLFTATYELGAFDGQRPYATGVDFARHEDYRVILTLDRDGRVVHFDRQQHETWPEIHRAVLDVSDRYPGVVAVDASRDNKIVSDLEADGVNVEPVKFSAQRKRELIENLITAIESEELSAPEIPDLRHEMQVFEYDVTRGGNLRYDAPAGFHDDTVDALALANDVRDAAARTNVAKTARSGGGEDYGDSDGDAIREAVDQYRRQQRDVKGGKW
jgi:hypothetical protein